MASTVEIIINAKDNASGVLRGVSSTLGGIAKAAGAVAVAGAVAFAALGKQALDATAEYERLSLTMQALAARELKNADASMTMEQAYAASATTAKDLLKWTEQLAIKSPFDQTSVANSFRMALTYGFTSEEAKKLTQNLIDMASATGQSADVMERTAYALGQVKAKGHLAGQEILQLVNAGVPVNDILGEMGFTLEDVSKGLVDADSFLAAFNNRMEKDFAGAAERQTLSWAGLVSTLGDLKKIGLRELFAGIFDRLQPVVIGFSAWLQGDGMTKIRELGQGLGDVLSTLGRIGEKVAQGDLSFVTAMFSNWASSVDWATLSTGLANGIKSIDWAAVGLEIRTAFLNIMNGLSTIASEVDWGALLSAIGTALQGVLAGLYGYASFDQLATDFNNGFVYIGLSIQAAIESWKIALITKLNDIKRIISDTIATWKLAITQALAALVQPFIFAGQEFVRSMADGIKNGASAVIGAVKSIVDSILKLIPTINIPIGVGSGSTGSNSAPKPGQGYASGGIATGSGNGHWELLHGTEGIFTRDQMAMLAPVGSGAGGVTINLTYAPAVSLASEAELEQHLLPVIMKGARQAWRQR